MRSQKKSSIKTNSKQFNKQTLKTVSHPQKQTKARYSQTLKNPKQKRQAFISKEREIQNTGYFHDLSEDSDEDTHTGPKVNDRFIWLNYCGMLLGIAAGISFLLHCFAIPFLLPVFATLFYGTVFAQNLHLFAMGLTFLVSGTVAFFVTEKIQSNVGNGFLQANEDPTNYDFYPARKESAVKIPLKYYLKTPKPLVYQFHHHKNCSSSVIGDEMTVLTPGKKLTLRS